MQEGSEGTGRGDAEAVQWGGVGGRDRQAASFGSSSFFQNGPVWPEANNKNRKYHLSNSPRSIVSW